MRLLYPIVLFAAAVAFVANAQTIQPRNTKSLQHIVSDAVTAIKIVMVIAEPILGEQIVSSQAPFMAVLDSGVWQVQGNIEGKDRSGSLYAEIRASTGEILKLTFGGEPKFHSIDKPTKSK